MPEVKTIVLDMLLLLLPTRTSEQGNVIGSVHIYYVYKKNCN